MTGAFERFMSGCVELSVGFSWATGFGFWGWGKGFLVDWLGKGKQFYRAEGGEEVNIEGQLLWLLPRVQDAALKGMIEEALKKSVS